MNETYLMLKSYAKKDLCELTYEELAHKYQKESNSDILASSYVNIYKLANTISSKYYTVDPDDVQSYCLEKLDYCLRTYDSSDKSFISYFCTCYKNMLNDIIKGFNRMKRINITESLDTVLDIGIEDTYNLLSVILPTTLTNNERRYCELASEGYNNTDIANYLGVSRMTICNIRKSLKVKLNDLQII